MSTERTSTTSGPAGGAMIEFRQVGKTYPGSQSPVVTDLSFEVLEGEICVLVGPSGCGKTTTMRMVNRLIEITEGEILIDGEPNTAMSATRLRRKIGYAIQQIGLFPHRTIADNIGTVPHLLGWDKGRIRNRVDELLELVGLSPGEYRDRYPAELSGGQQQRVGVARALAADPPVLLMDEPYSAVDPIVRTHLQDELLGLQERVQKTIVLVTHDIDEAIKLADRIAILAVGGVLEQYGTPEELLRRPANEFVERFLGRERGLKRMALLKVRDVPLSPGAAVAAEARPEEAKEVMARFGVDWVGVLDGDRLRGWAAADDLDGRERVGDAPVERFVSWVTPATALREALDTIVTSRTRAAVVLEDDRYVGMVFLDQIAEGVE